MDGSHEAPFPGARSKAHRRAAIYENGVSAANFGCAYHVRASFRFRYRRVGADRPARRGVILRPIRMRMCLRRDLWSDAPARAELRGDLRSRCRGLGNRQIRERETADAIAVLLQGLPSGVA